MRGRDIKRYSYDFANIYLINTHNGYIDSDGNQVDRIDVNDYPAIKKHLDKYWDKIEKRYDQGDTPYNLRNCAYMEDFDRQKMLWAETIKEYFDGTKNFPRFTYENGNSILDKTVFMLTAKSNIKIKYIIGVLNSKLMDLYLRQTVVQLGKGSMGLGKIFIEKIPIPLINQQIKNEVENYVNLILIQNENKKTIEKLLDDIVFKIYNLNNKEIDFVKSY